MGRSKTLGLLQLAIIAGLTPGMPYYAGMNSPVIAVPYSSGKRLYHHFGSIGGSRYKSPKFKRSKREGQNQRQVRKNRRRAHAAGARSAFA